MNNGFPRPPLAKPARAAMWNKVTQFQGAALVMPAVGE